MPLHPVAQSIVDGSKQPNARPNAHLNPVPVARANFESDFGGLKKPEVGEVRDLMIKVRDGSEIRGRLYLPAKKSTKSEPPIVIYYHGGGWLLGSIDSHDACTRLLCLASDCAILSVDYRRGPESKFPTAVYDAVDSVKWAVTNAKELGVDKDKIAVAGDSAGGNLAAVVSIILRDEPVEGVKIAMQVLVYPVTTCDLDKGFDVTWEGVILYRDELQWHQDNYLSSPTETSNPHVAPLLAANLSNLPPAIILIAECDPIKPQSVLYADALKKAGNNVETWEGLTLPHGFFGLDELFTEASEGMEVVGRGLKKVFGLEP